MFVQVFSGQVSDPQDFRACLDRWMQQLAPSAIGWLGSTSGVTDDGLAITLARFESAEAARRNSERPEQGEWWMETAKVFTGDVTFHDCTDVLVYRQPSDTAGFVQVMQGRTTDARRVIELTRRLEDLRDFRPDLLGGLLAVHPDGSSFTEAAYFTNEAEARAGERGELPAEMQAMWDEMSTLVPDLRYYDLHQPWLYSPPR